MDIRKPELVLYKGRKGEQLELFAKKEPLPEPIVRSYFCSHLKEDWDPGKPQLPKGTERDSVDRQTSTFP